MYKLDSVLDKFKDVFKEELGHCTGVKAKLAIFERKQCASVLSHMICTIGNKKKDRRWNTVY